MKKAVLFSILIGFLVVIIASVLAWYFLFARFNVTLPPGEERFVIIKKGMNVEEIGQHLIEEGVLRNAPSFVLAAKLSGRAKQLKAGRYRFAGSMNNRQILEMLSSGKASLVRVTIPEGKRAREVASILKRTLDIDSARVMALVNDSSFAAQLNVPGKRLEGFLFPDTYFFYYGQKEKSVLQTLVAHFFEVLGDSLRTDIEKSPFSLLETVTLASLIQGEAMLEDEMPLISAVYHNRLRRGMLLQADPTLQYIIPDGPRRLTNRDKNMDSPYNTYRYPGLPPGPINNPGLRAIRAAVHPANVPYLYFVARGDGGHTFSKTLQEHLIAKRKFDQIRREYYRKQKSERGSLR